MQRPLAGKKKSELLVAARMKKSTACSVGQGLQDFDRSISSFAQLCIAVASVSQRLGGHVEPFGARQNSDSQYAGQPVCRSEKQRYGARKWMIPGPARACFILQRNSVLIKDCTSFGDQRQVTRITVYGRWITDCLLYAYDWLYATDWEFLPFFPLRSKWSSGAITVIIFRLERLRIGHLTNLTWQIFLSYPSS